MIIDDVNNNCENNNKFNLGLTKLMLRVSFVANLEWLSIPEIIFERDDTNLIWDRPN